MSDISSFPYVLLRSDREIVSIANLTRPDGDKFMEHAGSFGLQVRTTPYPPSHVNEALADLPANRLQGAAVLVP